MIEDAELLRCYAEERSEEAFAELVHRRIGLVYSVACRHTHNVHRAEEVTQAVFTALARKAGALARRPVLVGWLHRSAQFAASDAVRAERRRQAREQEAHIMQQIAREGAEPDWEKLQPVLDEVLNRLPDRDRDAVLLRFFDGQSFSEIGRKLQLTENTARMRVERALGKLHAQLARRGVNSTAAALSVALGSHAALAVPAGLATTVSGAALATVASGSALATAAGVFLSMSKIKVGVAAALVIAGISTTVVEVRAYRALDGEFRSARSGTGDFARLKSENDRLTRELSRVTGTNPDAVELARVRNRIAAVRAQPVDAEESKMIPAAKLRNVGWDTVDAAAETILWSQAQDTGLVFDVFAQSYALDRVSKPKADAIFAGLTPEAKMRFGTAERLFVQPYFGMRGEPVAADPIAAYQILGKQNHEGDPDEVIVRWWQESRSGKGFEGRMILTRGEDGWKQRRKTPLSEENWQKIAVQVDRVTGELLPQTNQP